MSTFIEKVLITEVLTQK